MPNPDDDDDIPVVTAVDPYSALHQWLSDQLNPEQMPDAETLISDLLQWATGEDGWAADTSPAQRRILATDAYTGVSNMVDTATIKEIQAIRTAEAETGIMGMDSAFSTYVKALKALGQDTSGLHGSTAAARTIYNAVKNRAPRYLAADSKTVASRSEMFPNANRLGYN